MQKITRDERAKEILSRGEVYFTGDFEFQVASATDSDVLYNVNTQDITCECHDFQRGNICKHLRAAKMWMLDANLYQRARQVVHNNGQWYAGQMRMLAVTPQGKIYVIESQQRLFLTFRNGKETSRVQCGHLTMSERGYGWQWLLSDVEYENWVKTIQ